MPYNHNVLNHVRAIQRCTADLQLNSRLDIKTFKLLLRGRGRSIEFLPQFICRNGDRLSYTPQLRAENVVGFLGWRPYFNRMWPLAADKINFKRFCRSANLSSPRIFEAPEQVDTTVLLKKSRSSFGQGIIGPISAQTVHGANYSLADGEYFEEFVRGQIAKIWYWNDQVASISLDPMPTVVGDGQSALRQLIARKRERLGFSTPTDEHVWEAAARSQQLTLDSVIAHGRDVLVDFRYNSPLHAPVQSNNNALARLGGTPLLSELAKIGSTLWMAIPDTVRMNTLFTVDAIIDGNDRPFLLEMNCNPLMHVDAYPVMVNSLFNPPHASPRPSVAN